MNCAESQDLLHRRLDGEPLTAAELAGHLADCAACRALHSAAGVLERGLRLRQPPEPSRRDRTRDIVAAVLADRRVQQRRQFARVLALAASVLMVIGLVQWNHHRTAHRPLAVVVPAPAVLTTASVVAPPPVASLRDSVADAGSAVVALTRRTADETREQTKLFTEVLPMPLPTFDVGPPVPEPVAGTNVWQETGQRVATGFEPITSSARRAFSMFVRETPVPRVN